jgi:hypothetical protein
MALRLLTLGSGAALVAHFTTCRPVWWKGQVDNSVVAHLTSGRSNVTLRHAIRFAISPDSRVPLNNLTSVQKRFLLSPGDAARCHPQSACDLRERDKMVVATVRAKTSCFGIYFDAKLEHVMEQDETGFEYALK